MSDSRSTANPVAPCDFVVFGGTGDLAVRKLLPALYLRDRDGQLPAETRIVAVSRAGLDDARLPRQGARRAGAVRRRRRARRRRPSHRFLARLHHVEPRRRRRRRLAPAAPLCSRTARPHGDGPGVLPRRARPACSARSAQRPRPDRPGRRQRPGWSWRSRSATTSPPPARSTTRSARSSRSPRSSGSTTTSARRASRTSWSPASPTPSSSRCGTRSWIDHVQITVAESLGVGSRGGYYDDSGALRDMVQNHLLQLLCLVAMEPPDVRRPRDRPRREAQGAPGAQADDARRRRPLHRRGPVRPRAWSTASPCPAYTDDARGPRQPHRDLRRAEGRGAELALGRRAVLPAHRQADGPPLLGDRGASFKARAAPDVPAAARAAASPTGCVIQLQPDEGMRLHLTAKEPGPGGIRLRPVSLDLSYAETFQPALARRLRAAADGRRPRQPDPVHAPRRGRGRLGVGRADPGRLGRSPNAAHALPGRHHRPDRRRPRSSSATAAPGTKEPTP